MLAISRTKRAVQRFPKLTAGPALLCFAALIFLAGISRMEAAAPAQGYATNLCNVHNRFRRRIACAEVAPALQWPGVEEEAVKHLIGFLRAGERRRALALINRLAPDLESAPAQTRAAAEYVRGTLLQLD